MRRNRSRSIQARALHAVEGPFEARELEPMTLKGFRRPVEAFEILGPAAERK
jgi:adenylate cyclase